MQCWNCGAQLDLGSTISFRSSCEAYQADLHCCQNCKFYKPGRANDCMIPGTEFVAERKKNNLCEDFRIQGIFIGTSSKKDDAIKRFNDLFKE